MFITPALVVSTLQLLKLLLEVAEKAYQKQPSPKHNRPQSKRDN